MSTILEQLQYGFDRDSRRTWRQRAATQGWDNAYVYDSLSQVIGDDRGDLNLAQNAIAGIPNNGSRWQYDETGNWHGYQTLANGAATLSQSRMHDKGNRLMEVSEAAAMRTDRAGRMTEAVPGPNGDWNSTWQIKWDAWSRIVELDSQGISAAYAYDGLARRISRYTNLDDVTLHSYYNDEWRPVEDRRNAGTTAEASYLWGVRHRDDLVRRDRATTHVALNETRYILMDYFSPAAITDEEGDVTERYQFSAFGLRTILNPDFTVRSDSECGMEFSFQGQFEDIETGWMNYGYRYYLPALGRWTSKDLIQTEEFNIYSYVVNQPLDHVDHYGLCTAGKKCECRILKHQFQSDATSKVAIAIEQTKVGGGVIESGLDMIINLPRKVASWAGSAVSTIGRLFGWGVSPAPEKSSQKIVDDAGKKTLKYLGSPTHTELMMGVRDQMVQMEMANFLALDSILPNQEIYLDMTIEYKECKCGLFFNSYETVEKTGRDGPWVGMPKHQAMLVDMLYSRLCGESGADFDPCP